MGIINRGGALYFASGIDNTGLYKGRQEALGIIKAMTSQITSFDVFGGIGISAAMAFGKAAKDSYNFSKEFDKNMREVMSISTAVTENFELYQQKVIDMTKTIPVGANEAAKALYQIVSAGHDGAAGMQILEASARAAIGGVTDTATAADAITTLINAYKQGASDANSISDQLFTTVRLGKTTFGELGQSIAQVAPIAASYGVEMDQVLAAVATLTKSGTPTAQAMTQIRASIVGVSKVLGDGAFETRTYQEALAEVAKMAGGSESKLRELVPEIEAVNGVLGMTGINAQAAASDLAELSSSAGATETAFKKMAEGANAQLKLLQNNIVAATRPMGETIMKEVADIAKKLNEAFANGDIQKSLETLKTLVTVAGGAFVAYKIATSDATKTTNLEAIATDILNRSKQAYNLVSGQSLIQKEQERVAQAAYIVELEKSLTAEQQAKLAKLDLKAGTKEYADALSDMMLKERDGAQAQVESLTKSIAKNRESLSVAKEKLQQSNELLTARKMDYEAAVSANDIAQIEIAQSRLNTAAKNQEKAAQTASTIQRRIASQETKLQAASTAAETITTKINTATTKANSAAKVIATTVTNKLRLASKALFATIAANPIGALLTVITLAITAMMAFGNETEKAAEVSAEFVTSLKKEREELDKVFKAAKDAAEGTDARKKAIDEINNKYGKYLKNLLTEKSTLEDIQQAQLDATKALAKDMAFKSQTDAIKDYQENYAKALTKMYSAVDDITTKLTNEQKGKFRAYLEENIKDAVPQEGAYYGAGFLDKGLVEATGKSYQEVRELYSDWDVSGFDAGVQKVIRTNASLKKATQDTKEIYDAYLDALFPEEEKKANIPDAVKELPTILQQITETKEELAIAEKKVKDLRGNDSTATVSEIEKAEKEVKALKTKLETLTGVSTKQFSSLKKNYDDIGNSIIESELKLQAAHIAIMEDGKNKRLAQSKQEHDERALAIDKEFKELQKKYKESQQEVPEAVEVNYQKQKTANDEAWEKRDSDINDEYSKEVKEHTKALADVFVSEEQRKVEAIKERYRKEQEWADKQLKNGGMTEGQYKDYSLSLNAAETQEVLKDLLDKYRDFAAQRKEIETAFTTEIKILQDNRTDANKAETDAAIAEAKRKQKEAIAAVDLEAFQKEIDWNLVFGDLDRVSTSALAGLRDKMQKYLTEAADSLSHENFKTVTDAFEKLNKALANRTPLEQFTSGFKSYKTACDNVAIAEKNLVQLEKSGKASKQELEAATKKLSAAQDARRDSLVKMTQAVNSMGDKGQQLVQAGNDIVGMLDNFGVKVPESLTGTLDGLGQIASGLSQIDLTKPFSVLTGVTGILGGIGKTIGSIFGLGNKSKKHEKNIQALRKEVEGLEQAYDKLGKAVDKAYSSQKVGLIDQQEANLKKQQELLKQQIAEEEAKKKTDKEKIDEWKNQIEDLNEEIAEMKDRRIEAIMGKDIQSAIDDFASAYAEAWAAGEDKRKAIKDVVRDMIKGAVIEMIKMRMNPEVTKLMEFLSNAVVDGIDSTEQGIIDRMTENIYQAAEAASKGLEQFLDNPDEDSEQKDAGLAGAVRREMTEETASELTGLFRSYYDLCKLQLDVNTNALDVYRSCLLNVQEILKVNYMIEHNTARMVEEQEETNEKLDKVEKKLDEIEYNTKQSQSSRALGL